MQQTLDSSDIFKSVAPADWLIAAVVLGNTLGNATKQVVIQIAVPVPAAYALGFQSLLCRISQHQCVLFVCVCLSDLHACVWCMEMCEWGCAVRRSGEPLVSVLVFGLI